MLIQYTGPGCIHKSALGSGIRPLILLSLPPFNWKLIPKLGFSTDGHCDWEEQPCGQQIARPSPKVVYLAPTNGGVLGPGK